MKVAVFGSSLVSAYRNGAATYYRGLIRSMHALGFDVTFYEPDACERQQHRDIDDPDWARVFVYDNSLDGLARALDDSWRADVVVKASGVGVFDREHIVEAVRGSVRILPDQRDLTVTVSVGVAMFDDPGALGRDVLVRADMAMYEAKQAGRDRSSTHCPRPDVG